MELFMSKALNSMDVMVEAEATVAEFYSLCSERFTEHAEFWGSLAKEEQAHAEVIRKLIQLVRIHPTQFAEGKTTPLEAINAFIGRTHSSIEDMRRGELPEEKALLIAYQIENTVIEAQYADVVNTENEEYKALLGQILAETLKHKESVLGKMKDLKKGAKKTGKKS